MRKKRGDEGPVKNKGLIPIPEGEPISDELAEQLADEAERGYADIETWKRESVGRPSLSGNGASPRMSFRITPELYLALERQAAAEEKTVSQVARDAIARHVGG